MPMQIQRGGGGVASTYWQSGARTEWVVSTTLRPVFTRKDAVPIVQEAMLASRPVCVGMDNLNPTGLRPPKCSASSESLYRLSYPGRPEAATDRKWTTH
jgi:hypothetical protein